MYKGGDTLKQYKNKDGSVVFYNYRNEEMNRNLRKLGHKVVSDKKKQGNKHACRKKSKDF